MTDQKIEAGVRAHLSMVEESLIDEPNYYLSIKHIIAAIRVLLRAHLDAKLAALSSQSPPPVCEHCPVCGRTREHRGACTAGFHYVHLPTPPPETPAAEREGRPDPLPEVLPEAMKTTRTGSTVPAGARYDRVMGCYRWESDLRLPDGTVETHHHNVDAGLIDWRSTSPQPSESRDKTSSRAGGEATEPSDEELERIADEAAERLPLNQYEGRVLARRRALYEAGKAAEESRCQYCGGRTPCTYWRCHAQHPRAVEPQSPAPPPVARWRVGRSLGRTLYRNEQCVGIVDTPEIAAEIVAAVNGRAGHSESEGRAADGEDGARRMYEHAKAQPGTNPPEARGHIPDYDGLDEYGKAWMRAAYRFCADLFRPAATNEPTGREG